MDNHDIATSENAQEADWIHHRKVEEIEVEGC